MNGKGFPEMLKRQAAAEEASQARMNKFKAEQLQKIQEETRRDRIERHKQKLVLQQSALPSSIAESLRKSVHREPVVDNKNAGMHEFKAEDPAKVCTIRCLVHCVSRPLR